MQLDLTRIREAETPVTRQFEAAALQAPDDVFRLTGPVALDMTVRRDDDLFHLVGTIRGEVELACSRCLEAYPMRLDLPFDLRYLPQHMNEQAAGADDSDVDGDEDEEAAEVGGDDLSTAFYRDDRIDLTQMVREQIYLALPMKPLHRDDCKGLCPNCGTNLNDASCGCQVAWEDPRLAPLKALQSLKNRS